MSHLEGPVDSDVSYLRETPYVVHFHVLDAACHRCGSQEVWQPGQTMDMPMVLSCLRCGEAAPTEVFET